MKLRLHLKLARSNDIKPVTRLFSAIGKINHAEVGRLIDEKKVFVFKQKNRVKAAFSYSTLGIGGFFAVMYIRKLAVDKTFRKKGIGSFVLRQIKQLAQVKGLTAFFLFSLAKSQNFYRKNNLKNIWRLFWWSPENS
ncbi:MAG: hypothetical protein UT55_C0004G0024 [Candidatus Peregrinibacteria bacterium GW2011_GWE2_39_6]|nr:MAG: hypothetical protein UT36_C0004G0063 [Candidatus Peregrinibacteria bacterium GW2011_GWF2_39_17]KKR26660.1 MAG: hypothetical protein UT55_C0004G0024 [Candidatus Peregrinibacteria bacterium GW2011_GWE2_39_6]HCW32651.1 hypothetical protein [Candidatus Peregrinibacteria bacterium]